MENIDIEAFVIMSKDRKFLATGNPRNRQIKQVDDIRKGERLLTYKTEGAATSAFTKWGFYGMGQLTEDNPLEAVPVMITIQERKK